MLLLTVYCLLSRKVILCCRNVAKEGGLIMKDQIIDADFSEIEVENYVEDYSEDGL